MHTFHRIFHRIALLLAGVGLGLCAGLAAAADVVPVVAARNPVTSLTKAQVADIFLGKANRYPDGSPAVPIDLAEGSVARDEFYVKYAGKSPAQVKAHWSKIIFTGRGQPPAEATNSADLKKRVADSPSAIGYLETNLVDAGVKVPPEQ